MKRFLTLLSILYCGATFAETYTMDWYMDGNIYAQTTCQTGDDIILPQTPYKYGYTFAGWYQQYTPIEYLESTGTQWIDTGIKTAISLEVESVLKVVSSSNVLDYSGATYSGNQGWIAFGSYGLGELVSFFANKQRKGATIPFDHEFHKYYLRNGLQKIDEIESYNTITSMPTTFSLYLFKGNVDFGANFSMKQQIKSCKIWDNNVLVRDFIPVLDMYGTPCLFDNIENKFYYNAGTGQFIAGPII